MRFVEKLKAVPGGHKPTEYHERLIEDGTTNVVACKFWIKPSTVSKVKTMKIRDREIRLKMNRIPGDDEDKLEFSLEREDASEEWIFEAFITLANAADVYGVDVAHFIEFIANPGTKEMCTMNCIVGRDVDATFFFHIECSLFLPLGELFCPVADAVLVCGEEEFPVNRNYTSHFSKYLLELFSKDQDDSKKFKIEVCTAEELKSFLAVITSLHPQGRPFDTRILAAYRAMSGAQSIFYGVETNEVDTNYNSRISVNVFENVKFGREQELKLLSYAALERMELKDFKKNKESFDKLDAEVKKMCEERRVELEEWKKDAKREKKEMKEWKKKEEEERKRRLKMKKRKENRKEKKGLEREKKRMVKEKKRNVM